MCNDSVLLFIFADLKVCTANDKQINKILHIWTDNIGSDVADSTSQSSDMNSLFTAILQEAAVHHKDTPLQMT